MRTLGTSRPLLAADPSESGSESDVPSDSGFSRVSLHTLHHATPTDADSEYDAETVDADALSDPGAGVTRRGFAERPLLHRPPSRLSRAKRRVWKWIEGPAPSGTDDPLDPNYKPLTKAERQRVLVQAVIKLTIMFVSSIVILGVTLYVSLPQVEPDDKEFFRLPRSFDQLKLLNTALQKYKEKYNLRIIVSWVSIDLVLQAFSIPGSMYMSIIAGALWSAWAWPLVVCTIACGASLAYLISLPMGALLDVLPNWKRRVDSWKVRINAERNLISYLVVVRMAPVPPHSVINMVAPHLGISLPTFWVSTALGIAASSFIHVTIGQKLDEMVSPDEFSLVSWHNVLILGGVCLAAMFPIAVRKLSAAPPLEETAGVEGQIALPDDDDDDAEAASPARRRVTKVTDVEDVSDDELPAVGIRSWAHQPTLSARDRNLAHRTVGPLESDADVDQNPFDSDEEENDAKTLDADPSVWGGSSPLDSTRPL